DPREAGRRGDRLIAASEIAASRLTGVPHGPEEREVRAGNGGDQIGEPDPASGRPERAGRGVRRGAGPPPSTEEGGRRPGPRPPGRAGPARRRDAGAPGPAERVSAESPRPDRTQAEGPGTVPGGHLRGTGPAPQGREG